MQDLVQMRSAFIGVDDPNLNQFQETVPTAMPLPFTRATLSVGYNLAGCTLASSTPTLVLDTITLGQIFSGNITNWNDPRIGRFVSFVGGCNVPIKTLCEDGYSGVTATFVKAINSTSNIYLGLPTGDPSKLARSCSQMDKSADNLLFLIQLYPGSIGYLPTSTRSQAFSINYAQIYIPNSRTNVTVDAATNTTAWMDATPAATPFQFTQCPYCWPFVLTTYVVVLRQYTEAANSFFNYWKSPFLNQSDPVSCLNLHYSSLFLLQSTASDQVPRYYLPLSPLEKKNASDTLDLLTCIVDSDVLSILNTDFLALYTWSAAGLKAMLAGLGTLAGTVSIGLLIFGYNESLYKRDLRVLAAMSGDANFGMGPSTALLEQLYSEDRVVPLDHPATLPVQEEQQDLLQPEEDEMEEEEEPTRGGTDVAAIMKKDVNEKAMQKAARSSTLISKALVHVNELNLGGLIGSGSYGDVFKGKLRGNVVAVKRIPVTQDEELVQGFVKEVKAMVALNHPNILQMLAISVQNPYAYIVTEYCQQGAIDKYLQNHPAEVDVMRKVGWMKQIADAMAYLHSQHIIHRDLKLSNILLTSDLQVRVGDLGTAALGQQSGRTRVGTLHHCAPEIIDGRSYDKSCDVYSFAICLWSVFSSLPLYHGFTMYDIITRVTGGQRPPLDPIPSQKLASIVQACWAHEPSQRPTFEVISKALSELKDSDFETFT